MTTPSHPRPPGPYSPHPWASRPSPCCLCVSLCLCAHLGTCTCPWVSVSHVSRGEEWRGVHPSVYPSVCLCVYTFALETKRGHWPGGCSSQTGPEVQWTRPGTPEPLPWTPFHVPPPHPLYSLPGSGTVLTSATSTSLLSGPLHVPPSLAEMPYVLSLRMPSSSSVMVQRLRNPLDGEDLPICCPSPTPTVPRPSSDISVLQIF